MAQETKQMTHVFRSGCTVSTTKPLFPLVPNFSLFEGFSSPDEWFDKDVEKCLDDGARGRVVTEGICAAAAVPVFVVFPFVAVELARNRDWE